jgi:DNA topoisomerase-1
MVASQMAAALFNQTTIDCKAGCLVNDYLCRATSSTKQFPGFMTVYTEGKDESVKDEVSTTLPSLQKGDKLQLDEISTEQHFTQPPPRFTEATLIKFLEQFGIGRPSTYAPILSTIQERNYVTRFGGTLQPTELGIVVNDLLIKHFTDIINIEFTAQLEDELDEIANNNRDWVETMRHFYTPFEADLSKATQLQERVTLADETTEEICPKCQKPMIVKYGRYGRFIACSGYPHCKFTKPYQVRIGVSCPQCKGDLVEKMNRKKRIFYGCNNYPECNFATNQKPLTYPCPQCNGLLINYRKKWVKCINCDYKGETEIKVPTTVESRT